MIILRPLTPSLPSRIFTHLFSSHGRVSGVFKQTLIGEFLVDSPSKARTFLRSLLNQDGDRAGCVARIILSRQGLNALRDAFAIHKASSDVDSILQPVLSWLQDLDPDCTGRNAVYVRRTIQVLVDPPAFWSSYANYFKYELINEKSKHCFAWLLLQILTIMPKLQPIDEVIAKDPLVQQVLKDSSDESTRRFAQRIERAVESLPLGDRRKHWRNMSILPTAEHVLSDDLISRLWKASKTENEKDLARKRRMYMENLFRQYHADLVEEIKEDMRGAGHDQATKISKLKLEGIPCEDTSKRHGKYPWSWELSCSDGLLELDDLSLEERQKYIREHTDFIPDQCLGALFVHGELLAIVNVRRDEARLAKLSICVHIPDKMVARQVLPQMLDIAEFELELFSAAGFAHEPVLTRIKALHEIPFEYELLAWDSDSEIQTSVTMANPGIQDIVRQLENEPNKDLQNIMGLETSISLDSSQAVCLHSCLTQCVSLVQGPPGTGETF